MSDIRANPGVGEVMTVNGPISPGELGVTLMHEHVFADLRSWCHPPAAELPGRERAVGVPVSMEILGILRRDPYINEDNVVLDNEDLAVAEVRMFAAAGGRSLVEMSSVGLGGRRELLPSVSARSGIHIIAAAGFYKEEFLGAEVRDASEERWEEMLREDISGGEAGVAAGAIGEMGTSNPMTPLESRLLDVAARVASNLGLSLHIHLEPGARDGVRAMEVVSRSLEPHRVVLGHIDLDPDLDHGYISAMAETGAYLALDTFGLEHTFDSLGRYEPRDTERVRLLQWLVEDGHADRLVISHDVATKTCLRAYGGPGYDHFLVDIAPQLGAVEVSADMLHNMLVDAPAQLLASVGSTQQTYTAEGTGTDE